MTNQESNINLEDLLKQ